MPDDVLGEPMGDVTPASVLDPPDDPTFECARDGCTNRFARVPGRGGFPRLYCDDHRQTSGAEKKRKKVKDRAPRSTTINLGGTAPKPTNKDARAADCEAGARAMLSFIVSGVALAGDDVCAQAWNAQIPQMAAQIGELSRFHPGLANFFAPVGENSEMGLWLGLGFAAAPAILATLSHHHVLPDSLAVKVAGVATAVTDAASPVPDAAAA